MHNKLLNKIGTACLNLALSATSISAMGAANTYYRTRKGAYGRNNQYLAETGISPFSTTKFLDKSKLKSGDGALVGEESHEFHFEKGRKVKELLLVDAGVQNKSMFFNQAKPGLDVVEIDGGGITSLMAALSKYEGLDAVHIVSHAQSGAMQLGGELLDAEAFENNLSAFAALNGAIRSGGDLLLYGCELAKGSKGQDFLELIQANTHADLAASVDKTGNAAFGGNWDLEIRKGDIDAKPLPESIAMKDFTGVLQVISFSNYIGPVTGNATFCTGALPCGDPAEYVLVVDGELQSTYHGSGYLYATSGENSVYLRFENNERFDLSTNGGYTFYIAPIGANETFIIETDKADYLSVGPLTAGAPGPSNYVDISGFNTQVQYVRIRVSDGSGQFSMNQFAVSNITAANTAPTFTTLSSAVESTNEDTGVEITFAEIAAQGDEADVDGTVDAFVVQAVSTGTLLINGSPFAVGTNDEITASLSANWTPALNDNGTVNAFTITAQDDDGDESSTPIQATVTVADINDIPTFTTLSGAVESTNEDTGVEITFAEIAAQGDEADVDGTVDAFVVQAVSTGTLLINGSPFAVGTNDEITASLSANWTPALNDNGTVNAFTITAQDDDGDESSTPIQATVTVADINDIPTFTTLSGVVESTNEDTGVEITFAEIAAQGDEADVDGTVDAFVVQAVSTGTLLINGSPFAVGTNDEITASLSANWTPALSATGTLNAFTITAQDDDGDESSTPIQATVAVAAANDPPTFTTLSGAVESTNEDTGVEITFAEIAAQGDEADSDGTVDAFVVQAVSTGTLLINGSPFAVGTNDEITASLSANWTPALNDNGTVNAFTITAQDDDGDESSTPIQATVTVADINDIPTFTTLSGAVESTNEDTGVEITFAEIAAQGDEADVDGTVDAFVVQAVSTGTLLINGSPFAVGTNDEITASLSANWTPDLNDNGTVNAFTITAQDDDGDESSTPIQATVTVADINDIPTFTTLSGAVESTNEDTGVEITFAEIAAQGDEADVDGTVDAFVVQAVSTGTLLINGSPFAVGTNDEITASLSANWTPALNDNGTVNAFTITAQDDDGDESSTPIQATVTVADINDIPTFTTLSGAVESTNEDTGVEITFAEIAAQGDEADVDGTVDAFVVQAVSTGTLLINGSPFAVGTNDEITASLSANWTPALNDNGTVNAFTITAQDDDGDESSTPIQATVTVADINDIPTFTTLSGAVESTNEDTGVEITFAEIAAQGDEADVDGTVDAFVVQAVSTGTLLINGSPFAVGTNDEITASLSANWTPALNDNGTVNAFTITAQDDDGDESSTPIQATVTVADINDIPTFTTLSGVVESTNEDTGVEITFAEIAAQGDEADVDGTVDAFVVQAVSTGTLLINGSPFAVGTNDEITASLSANWTPAADENGTLNAFTITAQDDDGDESSTPIQATVSVIIVNDKPIIGAQSTTSTTQNSGAIVNIENFILDADLSVGPANESTQSIQSGPFTVSVSGETNDVIDDASAQLSFNGTNWDLSFNTNTNVSGSATLNVTVQDDGGTSPGEDTSDPVTVNVTVNDTNGPQVQTLTPANAASGVTVSSTITSNTTTFTADFDENISIGTGDVTLSQNGAVIETVDITDTDKVDATGTLLTLNFDRFLVKDSVYSINIASTAIVDGSANEFSAFSWSWTMEDGDGTGDNPNVIAAIPMFGETDVSPGTTTIRFYLDEPARLQDNDDRGTFIDAISSTGTLDPTYSPGSGIEFRSDTDFASGGLDAGYSAVNWNGSLRFNGSATEQNAASIWDLNVITIAGEAFDESNTYEVSFETGVWEDGGNSGGSGNDSNSSNFTFTTAADGTPPAFDGLASSPADDDGAVDLTSDINMLSMRFTETTTVSVGSGNIELYVDGSPDVLLETLDVSSASLVDAGGGNWNLNFTLSNRLSGNLTYYILADAGIVEDAFNNTSTAITDENAWRFTTLTESNAPTEVSADRIPEDDASNVDVADNFTLVFDEPMIVGTGDIVLSLAANNTEIERISLPTDVAQLTFNGTSVEINWSSDLAGFTAYFVTVDAGALTDNSGNDYEIELSSSLDWNFVTESGVDGTGPVLLSTSPADGATDVDVSSDIILTFDEAVTASTGNITIDYSAGGDPDDVIPASDASLIIANNIVTIPNSLLSIPFDDADVDIELDADAFQDGAGNANSAVGAGNFTFASETDNQAPQILSTVPTDDQTLVPLPLTSLTINTDENTFVETGTINILLASDLSVVGSVTETAISGTGTQSLTVNISSITLQEEREYLVSIPSNLFRDASGNLSSSFGGTNGEWSFTTQNDVLAPTVAITRNAVSTGSFATGTADDPVSFNLAFSEELDPASFDEDDINVTLSNVSIGTEALNQTADQFPASSIILTTSDNQNYTLTFSSIAIVDDLAGNGTISIDLIDASFTDSNATVYSSVGETDDGPFIIDQISPTINSMVISSSLGGGSALVGTTITVSMEFSEDLATNPTVEFRSGNGLTNDVPVSINPISGSQYTAEYVVSSLDNSGEVTYTVDVEDLAGNTVSFTEGDETSALDVNVDADVPELVSITRNAIPGDVGSFSSTNADEVSYEIVFTERVGNFNSDDNNDLIVSSSGLSGITRNLSTSDNITWTLTFSDIAGNGSLSFDLINDGSTVIRDDVGNTIPDDLVNGNIIGSGASFTFDNIAPGIDFLTKNTPTSGTTTVTNATSVSYALRFDQVIDDAIDDADFDFDDILINISGGATVAGFSVNTLASTINGSTPGSIELDANGDNRNYTITINNIGGNGDVGLTLIGANIQDAADNFLGGGTGVNQAASTFEIDNTQPTVTPTLASTALTNANSVTFNLAFSSDVTGTVDLSDFTITTNGTVGFSGTALGGTSPNNTFTINGVTGDGEIGLEISTSGITDDAGNLLSATNPIIDIDADEGYFMDNTLPTVDITRTSMASEFTNATSVQFDVEFSEAVNGVSTDGSDFSLTAPSPAAITGVAFVSGNTYRVTVAGLTTNDGTISLAFGTTDIADPAGNGVNTTPTTSETYLYDQTAPTVSVIDTDADDIVRDADVVTFTATFTEGGSGLNGTPQITITNDPGGTPTVVLATIDMVATADPLEWTYVWDVPSGEFTDAQVSISVADNAGNNIGSQAVPGPYVIDNTGPGTTGVISIASSNTTKSTSFARTGQTVTVTFTANETLSADPVINFFRSNGALVNNLGSAFIGGTGPNYTANYVVNSNDLDGPVTFEIAMTDVAGNEVTSAITAVNDASFVTVDNTAPIVTIARNPVTNGSFSQTNDDPVSFDINFNESIDNNAGEFDVSDDIITSATGLTLTPTLAADGGISTTDFTLSYGTISGNGDLSFTLESAGSSPVTDIAGNPLASDATSEVITIDNDAPTNMISAAINGSSTTEINVTFSENVGTTGTNPTDFTVIDEDNRSFLVTAIADDTPNDAVILITVGGGFGDAEGDLLVTYTDNGNNNVFDLAINSAVTTGSATIERTFTGTVGISEIATNTAAGDTNGDDVAMYRPISTSAFNMFSDTPITITPSIATGLSGGTIGSTISIYRDEALTDLVVSFPNQILPFAPTVAQFMASEAVALGGTNALDYDSDANDINGVYTFYITETAVNETDSRGPAEEYSIAFLDDIQNTQNQINFAVGETTNTDLRVSNSLDQNLSITGVAIGSVTTASGTSFIIGGSVLISSSTFQPNIIGQGTYPLDFTWTNDLSDVSASFEDVVTFTITPVVRIFENVGDVNFAKDATSVGLELNKSMSTDNVDDALSGDDPNNPNFYDLQVWDIVDGARSTNLTGTLLSGPTVTDGVPSSTADGQWTLNPSAFTSVDQVDTLEIVLRLQNDSDNSIVENNDIQIYLFPDPQVTMNSTIDGLEDYYCVADEDFMLLADVTVYDGFSGNTNGAEAIQNGYVLEFFGTDATRSVGNMRRYDFTENSNPGMAINNFDPGDPDQSQTAVIDNTGSGSDITSTAGYYTIKYITDSLTAAKVVNDTVSYNFQVIDNPDLPTLLASDLFIRGGLTATPPHDYLLEFAEDSLNVSSVDANSFTAESALPSSTFAWYREANGGTAFQTGALVNIKDDVYGGSNPSGDRTVYLEATRIEDNAGVDLTSMFTTDFTGCVSDSLRNGVQTRRAIDIIIHDQPLEPIATISDNVNEEDISSNESGTSFLFEYCNISSDMTVSDLSTLVVNFPEDAGNGENVISDARAHFVLINPTTEDTTWFSSNTLNWVDDVFGSVAAVEDTVIQMVLVVEDSTFSLGDGNANAFRGVSSDTTRLEFSIFGDDASETVSDIVTQETSFATEYFTCQGDPIAAITTNNVSTGGTYVWYTDDGDLTFDAGDTEIVRSETLRNLDLLSQTTAYRDTLNAIDGATTRTYTNDTGVDGTPGIYYFWVTQARGSGSQSDFPGCESTPTLIAVTVFADSPEPTFSLDGTNFNSVVANNSNAVDFQLFYDAADLTSSVTFNAGSGWAGNTFDPSAYFSDADSAKTVINEFNWYTSTAGGARGTQVATGSTVTAAQLQLTGLTADDPGRYIYVEQVTNIVLASDGTTRLYDGCVSNGVVIQFTIFAAPAAPTGTTSFFYCEGEEVQDFTMNGEAGNTFVWLDANNNQLHSEVADASGVSVADVTSELGLGTNPETDSIYTIKVYQISDITTTNTSPPEGLNLPFAGAFSDTTSITIDVRALPANPVIDTSSAFCDEGDASPLSIAFTGDGNADSYTLYQGDSTTTLSQLSGNASLFLFTLDNASLGEDSTVYLSQTSFTTEDVDGDGCESNSTEVNVFPNPIMEEFTAGNIFVNEACDDGAINLEVNVSNKGTLVDSSYQVVWSIDGTERQDDNEPDLILTDASLSGTVTVDVVVTNNETTCAITIEQGVEIGTTPEPFIRVDNVTTGSNTLFTITDEILTEAQVRSVEFTLNSIASGETVATSSLSGDDSGNPYDGSVTQVLDAGLYDALVSTTSESGCINTDSLRAVIIPQVSVSRDTLIDFDDFDDSWFAFWDLEAGSDSTTWEVATPAGSEIDLDPLEGSSNIVVTNASGEYGENEVSYMYSPSFDITGLTLPAVSFDYYVDMLNVADGVSFQWSIDDGNSWNTLGEFIVEENQSTGRNWYTNNEVTAQVNVQVNDDRVAWAGDGSDWLKATHSLTGQGITELSTLRFRFALAARTGAKDGSEGFAFDNFELFSREKVSLVETFSSVLSENSNNANEGLDRTLSGGDNLSDEIIWVNFFTDLLNTSAEEDPLHSSRPTGSNARTVFYSIEEVPRAVLAGQKAIADGTGSDDLEQLYGITERDIQAESLESPDFTVEIGRVIILDNELTVESTFTARQSAENVITEDDQISVRIVVLQSEIDATLIDLAEGRTQPTSYKNVARAILPGAEGSLIDVPVQTDDVVFEDPVTWDISGIFGVAGEDVELRIVAFIQNEVTKEIYQVATTTIDYTVPETVTSISTPFFDEGESYELYPNPADKQMTIKLHNPVREELNWSLYDQAGKEVYRGMFRSGQQEVEVDTREIRSGLYLLKLFNATSTWESQRVIILRNSR